MKVMISLSKIDKIHELTKKLYKVSADLQYYDDQINMYEIEDEYTTVGYYNADKKYQKVLKKLKKAIKEAAADFE